MKTATKWTVSDVTAAKYLGCISIPNGNEDAETFEVLSLPDRLVFGGAVNAGFIESGFIMREDGESQDETLRELVADLETLYSDGRQFVSRIVCNDRV